MTSGEHSNDVSQPENAESCRARACATWPRLYLDTAELLAVADGKVDAQLFSELLAGMIERRVILVISIEHMQDAIPRADPRAASRMADALERFPLRAVVLTEPHEIEPWGETPVDITIGMAPNIREILAAPAAAPFVGSLSNAQDHLFNAIRASQEVRRSTTIARPVGRIVWRCLVALVRGHDGGEPDHVVSAFERETGAALDGKVRAEVIAQLVPWANLLRDVGSVMDPAPENRTNLLLRIRETVDDKIHACSPGLYLAARLAHSQASNIARTVKRSDSVDGMHARYFPYVDIATCDRHVYACIVQHLPKARGTRRVRLFRNGCLRDVVSAVNQLPFVAGASDVSATPGDRGA
jgi:hypothetical protein